jgi:hypothetical protein
MMSFQIFEKRNHFEIESDIFLASSDDDESVFYSRVPIKEAKCFLYISQKLFSLSNFHHGDKLKTRKKDKDKATVDKRVVMEWMTTEKIARERNIRGMKR